MQQMRCAFATRQQNKWGKAKKTRERCDGAQTLREGRQPPCSEILTSYIFTASTYLYPRMLVVEKRRDDMSNGEKGKDRNKRTRKAYEQKLSDSWTLEDLMVDMMKLMKNRIIKVLSFFVVCRYIGLLGVFSMWEMGLSPKMEWRHIFPCKLQQWLIYLGKNFRTFLPSIYPSYDMLLPACRERWLSEVHHRAKFREGNQHCCH